MTEGSHCVVCNMVIKERSVIPKLEKKQQSITVKKSNYTFKEQSLQNKQLTFSIKPKVLGNCKLTYRIKQNPKKYISVNQAGRVTLKKGIKSGKYEILVSAAESAEYTKAEKMIVIVIK